MSTKLKAYEDKQEKYEKDKVTTQYKQVHLEAQSRRENLLFHNINEQIDEKPHQTEKLVTQILIHNCKIPEETVRKMKFQRVHRLGRVKVGDKAKPRPIIAKFVWFKDRERVRLSAKNLKGTLFGISEDFPRQIREVRKKLLPIMRAARNATPPKLAILNVDQLYIDGNLYDGPEASRPYATV